ncbi:MAG: hypothetical protein G01um101418_52 [Parcubacteria group bacterium Gr01-1014_18]|nr:MAG: hypothetical protein Greene041636_52 [Parcubacteria group bacterium Greene0416_36]TSC81558.1 MAG: hypothetical protein G01um101418_52 [Parcubacteria group bacterium Gr01-1014_18]TSC99631.1 MAG: hypothetical protein Greene101420_35 [Parcubacteria group bacterium Greene1014_20]TSD07082.1 MAG: hypothetical protein Greene07142_394 [Parcubacteria group bacterium Greene0714_2]
MISKKMFPELLSHYQKYRESRHAVIAESSDILKLAKQSIFALHRNDLALAEKNFDLMDAKIKDINRLSDGEDSEGVFRAALEEYLEAKFFYMYLKGESVELLKSVEVEFFEEYLGAVCDVTGELVRRAVLLVVEGKKDSESEIKNIRAFTENVVAGLLGFDLVGKLRSKFDDAKRNLSRVEEILYDLKIRK